MRQRRTYSDIEFSVVASLQKLGKKGGSISQISIESKTNWKTTRDVIERLERLRVIKLIESNKRLKLYKIIV